MLSAFVILFHSLTLNAQYNIGIPMVKNYYAEDYNAHTQNFDIAEDFSGDIYFANFAGVLRFNGAQWSLTPTKDISRVTRIVTDETGKIYIGGLNEAGLLAIQKDVGLHVYADLRPEMQSDSIEFTGEVIELICIGEKTLLFTRDNVYGRINGKWRSTSLHIDVETVIKFDDHQVFVQSKQREHFLFDVQQFVLKPTTLFPQNADVTDILQVGIDSFLFSTTSQGIQTLIQGEVSAFSTEVSTELIQAQVSTLLEIGPGQYAVGTLRNGVYFIDESGSLVTFINSNHGLQNDHVNDLHQDRKGRLWAALNNGVSLIGFPWSWTKYDKNSGLKSGVTSIAMHNDRLFVGTYQGLHLLNQQTRSFEDIENIDGGCWQLMQHQNNLYAATSQGVFVFDNGDMHNVLEGFALSMCTSSTNPNVLYFGSIDGVMIYNTESRRVEQIDISRVFDNGQITKLVNAENGEIWIQNIDGQIAKYIPETNVVSLVRAIEGIEKNTHRNLFKFNHKIWVDAEEATKAYDPDADKFIIQPLVVDTSVSAILWPGLVYNTSAGDTWFVRGDETSASLYRKKRSSWGYAHNAFSPFQNFICRAIHQDHNGVTWLGGPNGLIRYSGPEQEDVVFSRSLAHISRVTSNSDSLLFGGVLSPGAYEEFNTVQHEISYGGRNVAFSYASTGYHVNNEVRYSSYLENYDKQWSDWTYNDQREYTNLPHGDYTFHVKAMDAYNMASDVASFSFAIDKPWYLKWYSIMAFVIGAGILIWRIVLWRLKALLKEKEKLEEIIEERIAEISEKRDQLQEKSKHLSDALSELKHAQQELIRKEKLASLGKLTNGLVDRMLNPLNYINNFSVLSKELISEITEVINEADDTINTESQEEIQELLPLLESNLDKIESHGNSAVRMIKGMEELIKDRSGEYVETDLNQILTSSINLVTHDYKNALDESPIDIQVVQKGSNKIRSIPTEISKVVHQLLDNAVYAVLMRTKRGDQFTPSINASIVDENGKVIFAVHDNGVGIPQKNVDRIFDPFYTTKTTAEGSGVGLYLVKEIVESHQGAISVSSEPNARTEFRLEFPQFVDTIQNV